MHIVGQALNLIDESNLDQIATLERLCDEIVTKNLSSATPVCGTIMDYIMDVSGGAFEYDARIFNYDFDPTEEVVN